MIAALPIAMRSSLQCWSRVLGQVVELALAEVKALQPITEILTSNLEQSALLPSIWTK